MSNLYTALSLGVAVQSRIEETGRHIDLTDNLYIIVYIPLSYSSPPPWHKLGGCGIYWKGLQYLHW